MTTDILTPPPAPTENWFYASNGKTFGPFTQQQMEQFVHTKVLDAETSVWSGSGDWIIAKNSKLAYLFIRPEGTPPPLASKDINNTLVWLVAFIPLLSLLGEKPDDKNVILVITLILNVGLTWWDSYKLKKAGHDAPKAFWCFIIPVYLYQRAIKLNQSKGYFFTWLAIFVLSIALEAATASNYEEVACGLVDQQLSVANNLGLDAGMLGGVKCVAVDLSDRHGDRFKAKVTLSNGTTVPMTFKKQGDMLYIE